MKRIISILFYLLCTLSFAQDNLALNFARGDLFSEIRVNTEETYPKSAVNVSVSLAYIKNANLTFKFLDLPVQGGFAIQQDQRTIFGTKDHGGVQYTLKTQELIYYFDRAGVNQIPPITLYISGTIRGKKISGTLRTKPVELKVNSIDSTFSYAALESSAEVEVDIPSDRELKKGDSLTYLLTLKSSGSSSLYLPQIRFNEAQDVVYYYKKLKSSDTSNRGDLESIVQYEVTAVYNRAGEFTPTISPIYYYNISSGEIESVDFDLETIQLSGFYITKQMRKIITIVLTFIALFVLVYILKREQIRGYVAQKLRKRQLISQFKQALTSKEYSKVISLFYKALDEFSPDNYFLKKFLLQVSSSELEPLDHLLENHYSSRSKNIHTDKLKVLFNEVASSRKCDFEDARINLEINT
ncbi:BatD family protein [Halobacteriovorax sp. HLS]|uniref:BatD family protein n=1 Tax=Halobacteriovorax sp. HLS TaxID=2234000 RepID=UPI000FD9D136|nr:BatD family protein [Halobacteriovorax sp. HLS]